MSKERWLFLSLSGLINTLGWLVTEDDLRNDLFCFTGARPGAITPTERTLHFAFSQETDSASAKKSCREILDRTFKKAAKDLRLGTYIRGFKQLNAFLRRHGHNPIVFKEGDSHWFQERDIKVLVERANPGLHVIL